MPKPRINEFQVILAKMQDIHERKNRDYASKANPFSNFERSGDLISWFKNKRDKSFIALIGTKLARLAELSDGRVVQNESVNDTFLDLTIYCALWASYRLRFPYQRASINKKDALTSLIFDPEVEKAAKNIVKEYNDTTKLRSRTRPKRARSSIRRRGTREDRGLSRQTIRRSNRRTPR